MKRSLLVFLIIAAVLAYSTAAQSPINSEANELFGDNEEAEVIVVLKDDYNVLQQYGIGNYKYKDSFEMKKLMISGQQKEIFSELKLKEESNESGESSGLLAQNDESYDFKLTNTYTTVNGFAGKLKKSGYEKLKNNPKVLKIEKSLRVKVALDTSKEQVNASNTWRLIYNNLNLTGRGESVCIIDSGVDYTHPDLGECTSDSFVGGTCPKVIAGNNYCPTDSCNSQNSTPLDNNGHGTHVAGIVASTNNTFRGIAPDATIVAIKSLNSTGFGSTANIVAGIDWCVNNASKFNISVISMSLGTTTLFTSNCDSSSTSFTDAVANAIKKNISVIAATGNDGSTSGIALPACITNVTSVGSVGDTDAIASYSNRNSITDLLAPGGANTAGNHIKSTVPKGSCELCHPSGFRELSGTSMAAPHVAAAFALLRQYKRLEQGIILTPAEIQDKLNDTGKQISDSGLTFSRINIYAAVLSLDTIKPGITFVNPTPSNNTNLSLNSTEFFVYINASTSEVLSSAILEINNGTKTNVSITINGLNSFLNLTSLKVGVVSFRIYGNDSAGNSNVTDLRVLQINNTAPNISGFAPSNEFVSIVEPNNQTFSVNFSDRENDTITFSWLLNSSLQLSGINRTEFNFTGNLTAAGFYVINVTLDDGSQITYRSWNLTVNNTNIAPTVTSVNLTNTDFLNRTNGTLQAFWSFNDSDGDAITANETLWYTNNTLISNYTNKTFIHPINTTKLENWTFSVRVFDGSLSDFVNSSTIKILNAKPVININTTSIILSETQQVNISLGASDLDNDFLNYTINDSRFFRAGDYFIWNTNLSDAGIYRTNITVNDSLDIDFLIINVTINDANDIDNDDNPDFNDTDKDSDGLNDSTDYLIGNVSTVNTTIQNLSIFIGNSTNLSQIFNQSFTINFTLSNVTIISFDFNFSKGVDNVSKTLLEKQSQTIVVNGKDYLVTPTFIDATRSKLIVNSEVTNFLSVSDSYTLSDGATIGVTGVTYQDFAGGIHSVDFYLSSKISSTLDLSKLTINRTTNGSSAVSIRGISLFNSAKTFFLEKANTTVKAVCVKDADAGFDFISSGCDSANETLLSCNNAALGQYSCLDTGARYKITGLSHSAVKEWCRDADGDGYGTECSAGDDCNDNDRSKTTDCSTPNSGGSSGGGGGGGGGGGSGGSIFVCNMDWKCGDWQACIDGLQKRQCNFARVPQHASEEECPSRDKAPAYSQKCEISSQASLAAETCNDGIKNQNEESIDCGGVCSPCKEEKTLTAEGARQKDEKIQPVGFAVKENAAKSSGTFAIAVTALIAAIIVVFAGIRLHKVK